MKKLALFLAIVTVLSTVIGCFGSFADDEIVNVFDKKTITKNKIVQTGVLKGKEVNETFDKYSVSDFIEVNPGDTIYYANADSKQTTVNIAEFYKSDKSYLSICTAKNVNFNEYSKKNKGLAVGSFVVPENAKYMRMNFLTGLEEILVVSINKEFTIEAYYKFLGKEVPKLRTDSPLYGKSVLFVGDSITEAAVDWNNPLTKHSIGWPGRIGYYNEMKFYNKGVSGASISNVRGNNLVVNQLLGSVGIAKNCDFIIMHGGVNDAWDKAPVGVMTDSFDPADFDRDTFGGGLEYTFYVATKQFPNAKLGYIINFRMTVSTGNLSKMGPYFDLAKQICDKWGIPYLDLFSDDNLNLNELKVSTTANLYDKIHPNASGFDILTPYIQTWMESLIEAEPAPTPTPTPTPVVTPTPDDTKTPDETAVPETTTPATEAPETTAETKPGETNALPFIIGAVVGLAIVGVAVFVISKKKKK